jgi:hypothetical protein
MGSGGFNITITIRIMISMRIASALNICELALRSDFKAKPNIH